MAEKNYIGKDGLLYLWQLITSKFVKKVDGKELSTNDYTTNEKTKLAGIATGATKDTVMTGASADSAGKSGLVPQPASGNQGKFLRGDGTWQTPTNTTYGVVTTSSNGLMSSGDKTKLDGIATGANKYTHPEKHNASIITEDTTHRFVTDTEKSTWNGKAGTSVATQSANGLMSSTDKKKLDDINVPTNNNQLTNGAGYQTASQVTTAINNAIGKITGIDFQVVSALPTTGVKGTIYMVSSSKTATNNIYDEYIYVDSKWEKIGTTDVDLSNYVQNTDLVEITNAEIDTICV